jgi:uncharacterized membrane protein
VTGLEAAIGAGDRHAAFWILGACAVTLLAGYLVKANCDYNRGSTYPPPCYSDLVGIYEGRGLAETRPYIDFPDGGTFRDPGFLEYPVGIGALVLAAAVMTASREGFVLVNALGLAITGLITAFLLVRMAGWRALHWALAPTLVIYAFLNWDLLAVACTAAGCFMLQRKRTAWAAGWFGVGAAVKLYPMLFLAPLVLERVWARDFRGAIIGVSSGIAAFVVPNLVLAAVNTDAWWATYAFHSARGADLGSTWSLLLPDASARLVNLLSAAALGLTATVILIVAWWRARRDGYFPSLAVGSALVVSFLLWSKVASPQYALWVLPSFVFLSVSVWWWIGWNALAFLIYGVSFGVGYAGYEPAMAPTLIKNAAFVRALFLIALGIALVNAKPAMPVSNAPPVRFPRWSL